MARVSAASVLYGEAETQNDTSKAQASLSSHQLLEKYFLETRELKVVLLFAFSPFYITEQCPTQVFTD